MKECFNLVHLRMTNKSIIPFFAVFIFLLTGLFSFGQTPEGINYQAAIRNADGTLLSNQSVGLKLDILEGSASGNVVYSENFTTSTTAFGLVNVVVGNGNILNGDFTSIDWPNGVYFLQLSVDETGGTNYTTIGAQQLVSVPYALHAKTAENAIFDAVDDADADSTNELQEWTTLPGIPNMLATMQNGEQYIGASQGGELVVVPVTFPVPFSATPRVLCTPNTEAGTIYDDSFNVTIREVTTAGFIMIVNRVDGSLWGQNMTVNWIAFEP